MTKTHQNRKRHWSERSWWNPRRWLAAPLIIAALGTVATIAGVTIQTLGGGFLPGGALALVSTLATVGAVAWAQSDLRFLKSKLEREKRDR